MLRNGYVQSKKESIEPGSSTFEVKNPIVTQRKGRPPKRLKSSVEITKSKGKQVLNESTNVYTIDDNGSNQDTVSTYGRKCSKCKQIGHYAKTCPSN